MFGKKSVVFARLALADGCLSELHDQQQQPPVSSSPSNSDDATVRVVGIELLADAKLESELCQGKVSEC